MTVLQTLLWSKGNAALFNLLIQKHSIPLFHFFPLRGMSSQDAEDIFSALKKAFADEGIEKLLKNIVFLSSDGASVNNGINRFN